MLEIWLARRRRGAGHQHCHRELLQLWVLYLVNDRDFSARRRRHPRRPTVVLSGRAGVLCRLLIGYLRLAQPTVEVARWPGAGPVGIARLMYHFPPSFTIVHSLADRPGLFGQELTRPLYRSLLMTGSGRYGGRRLPGRHCRDRTVRRCPGGAVAAVKVSGRRRWWWSSARAALLATFLQMPVGVSLLVGLPGRARCPAWRRFAGNHALCLRDPSDRGTLAALGRHRAGRLRTAANPPRHGCYCWRRFC